MLLILKESLCNNLKNITKTGSYDFFLKTQNI